MTVIVSLNQRRRFSPATSFARRDRVSSLFADAVMELQLQEASRQDTCVSLVTCRPFISVSRRHAASFQKWLHYSNIAVNQ